jgi:hypothetical protein
MASEITPADIKYKDFEVCILDPNCKKGIIVYHHYTQPEGVKSLSLIGIKTGKRLHEEGIDFGRKIYHSSIFFRAPHYNPGNIDYSTPEAEVECLYGPNKIGDHSWPMVWIRVNPDNTYVYSSEIRAKYSGKYGYGDPRYQTDIDIELNKSKKTMTQYMDIIKINNSIKYDTSELKEVYHLYSSEMMLWSHNRKIFYPFDKESINYHSEVLVNIPHLTPDYFIESLSKYNL